MSRTVAIIKTHALQHRLDIEHRLLEAKFEIVKERPMEFDTETDPEPFYELFDSDASFLSEGPVWVYVLDHSRPAVQTLLSLLPSFDNALIAARTDAQVEMQIAALFASSPPFPPAELPPIPDGDDELALAGEGGGGHGEIAERVPNGYGRGVGVAVGVPEFDAGSIRSINSGVLEALQFGLEARLALADSTTFDDSAGPSNARAPAFMDSRPSLALSDRTSNTNSSSTGAGKTPFRARPLPKTHLAPDITPRLTKAALLRQSFSSSPSNSPGRPRPRPSTMGTASTGRLPTYTNKENATSSTSKDAQERARKTFAGVPGHKRAETIGVASTKPPVVAPRLTKAAALRLGLERPATPPGKKGPSAANASSGRSGAGIKAGNGVNGGNIRSSVSVSPHTTPSTTSQTEEDDETETEAAVEEQLRKNIFEGVPGHKRSETISVCSVSQPPSILPRTNRSAALRKEGAPPPSSFMFRAPTAPKTPGSGTYSRSSSVMSAYRDSRVNIGSARSQSTVPPSRASSRISQFGGYAATKASYTTRATPANGSVSEISRTNGLMSTSNTTGSSPSNSHTCLSDPDAYFVDVDDPLAHATDPSTPATTRSRRPSSLQAPTIAPRVNKSAALRARKAAEDAAKPKSPYANAAKR
ncbi:hypothetical protein PISMIDRAFT_7683 [Pisolithus microcarpus 441]|uniref:Nucleoside diphosphate kinase n=1 Tax=Pisolithus microcarpus 441 TaxID=765257 RepID=A0A0C9YT73_9AGAM|nr:hypothetical protein PISMIDRAFT_7683 [Pisolithus microcarpus 441]